jgi:hypothetical protein
MFMTYGMTQCRKPDVEIDSYGNPHIFWSQRHTEDDAHSFLDIYYRNSTDGGDTWLYESETGRHGYNVTHVDRNDWTKFLPQRPRFKFDQNNNMYLVYTCRYELPSTGYIWSAFYLKYENGWPADPMDCEISDTYIEKEEADIALRYISNKAYPYITYTELNGYTYGHGRSIVRLAYQDTSDIWQDRLVYEDDANATVLSHFPCIRPGPHQPWRGLYLQTRTLPVSSKRVPQSLLQI